MSIGKAAPEWDVKQWLNTTASLQLADLRGRVVVVGAFQMLCPGCVSLLVPQLNQLHNLFAAEDVAVIGLHTVFEHHAAMQPHALAAFLHEYRIRFPVGVDQPSGSDDPLPRTMRTYGMQGTPTILLIDRHGHLRRQAFGHVPDLQLGAEIATLVGERWAEAFGRPREQPAADTTNDCADGVCPAPERGSQAA